MAHEFHGCGMLCKDLQTNGCGTHDFHGYNCIEFATCLKLLIRRPSVHVCFPYSFKAVRTDFPLCTEKYLNDFPLCMVKYLIYVPLCLGLVFVCFEFKAIEN